MPFRTPAALAAALALASGAARAQSAGAPESPSERAFSHPYGGGEASPRSEPSTAPAPGADLADLRDERPRPLRTLAIAGLGAGASTAGLGGLILLCSLGAQSGGSTRADLRGVGIGVLAVGGTLFAAGAVLLGVDAIAAPAPTPDGRGAQLVIALRFR